MAGGGGGHLSDVYIDGNEAHLGVLFIVLILFTIAFELIDHFVQHVSTQRITATTHVVI